MGYRRNNYTLLKDFGSPAELEKMMPSRPTECCKQGLQPGDNPLSFCLFDGVDKSFDHGELGATIYGKSDYRCQSFMNEYCARNFDENCEYALFNGYPDLKKNVNVVKHCKFDNVTYQQFDPLNPESPIIAVPGNVLSCNPNVDYTKM
jgi:hypothetical protein